MYAIVIAGWYGWEGLGGQGMDCERLAGLVWVGLEGLEMGCELLARWEGLGCEWSPRLVWEGLGIMTASSERW